MKLDHIVILVRSLDRSLPWYAALLGLLGFEKTRDHVWYDGDLAIDLKQAEGGTPDYQRYAPGLGMPSQPRQPFCQPGHSLLPLHAGHHIALHRADNGRSTKTGAESDHVGNEGKGLFPYLRVGVRQG